MSKINQVAYRIFADIQASDLNVPTANFDNTLRSVLSVVFALAALLSLVFIVIGGFKYTLSNGDPQGVAKAKDTILAAVIGLVLAISAFSIIAFVGGRL
jgi:hypothetical protein